MAIDYFIEECVSLVNSAFTGFEVRVRERYPQQMGSSAVIVSIGPLDVKFASEQGHVSCELGSYLGAGMADIRALQQCYPQFDLSVRELGVPEIVEFVRANAVSLFSDAEVLGAGRLPERWNGVTVQTQGAAQAAEIAEEVRKMRVSDRLASAEMAKRARASHLEDMRAPVDKRWWQFWR